ncbi:uncharacterized protein LOC9656975 [Selaginella moellendorffii]|uniref:uncharacterized protein LOC9656975 n=1 Tax=Selaginella moellendorffii TaxID=88036 RepID=UPI000D1CB11F|nr:uncharacterized protein LOC9656975 [Selaginella moellendorffii]|eukprot:XP_024541581.1 uncharacterized protein LOC9656975 [Selaginella moellendorffii]
MADNADDADKRKEKFLCVQRAQSVPMDLGALNPSNPLNPRRSAGSRTGLSARIKFAGTLDKIMGNSKPPQRQHRRTDRAQQPALRRSRKTWTHRRNPRPSAKTIAGPRQSCAGEATRSRGKRRASRRMEISHGSQGGGGSNPRGLVDYQLEKEFRAGRPGVFHFTNLKPGTRYKVEFKGCLYSIPGSFKTLSTPGSTNYNVNFGVISCNNVYITQKAIPIHSDLWSHLYRSVSAGKIDYLIHLGDQIYADVEPQVGGPELDRFQVSKTILADVPPLHREKKREEICELYRETYRETWSHPPTAKCLANCPNLMILDDHEIRDNWGDLPEDWDESSVEFFIARCGWIVYLEYQRQLHEDVDFSSLESIDKEYHFHVLGGVGLMFVDIRGSRTFHRERDDENAYLGTKQWKDISGSLSSPGGIFNGVSALLLCATAPLAFLEPVITNVAAKRVNRLEDFKGHWSAQPHTQEQIRMIDALASWKAAQDGRQVLVLGGDVHCGGHSEVLKDNEVVFQQLTSSAIANTPLPKTAYYFMRLVGRLGGSLRTGYTFKHYHWTRSRNYGLVRVKILKVDQRKPSFAEITSQLVKGKFMRGILLGAKVSSTRITEKKKKKSRPFNCCVSSAHSTAA